MGNGEGDATGNCIEDSWHIPSYTHCNKGHMSFEAVISFSKRSSVQRQSYPYYLWDADLSAEETPSSAPLAEGIDQFQIRKSTFMHIGPFIDTHDTIISLFYTQSLDFMRPAIVRSCYVSICNAAHFLCRNEKQGGANRSSAKALVTVALPRHCFTWKYMS